MAPELLALLSEFEARTLALASKVLWTTDNVAIAALQAIPALCETIAKQRQALLALSEGKVKDE